MGHQNFLYNLNFFNFLDHILFVSGDSYAFCFLTILYSYGCLLNCFVIYSYYSPFSTRLQKNAKLLILETFLIGGFSWIIAVSLAKRTAMKIVNHGYEDKITYNHNDVVKITAALCSLVAICPNIAAAYLYIRYKQHLRLVAQLDELLRRIEDNRTEFGNRNQIQEVKNLGQRRQSYLRTLRKRSCPNMTKNF